MEKNDPEGPKAIEEKLRVLVVPTLSLLRPTPVDGSLLIKCHCGIQFGVGVWSSSRQHHCRSCGKVFCRACTEKRVVLPEILVEYQNKSGWWNKVSKSRVCEVCYNRFLKYEECRPLLDQFYARPHALEKVFLVGQSNEIAQRAVSYYLSDMKRIQYLFPSEGVNTSQSDFLRTNRVILSTNPDAWLMQLLKVESIASTKKLMVHNAIDMIIFAKIYRNSLEIALRALADALPDALIPYLPVMAAIPDLRLYDILVEKSVLSPQMAFSFYWALNVLGDSKYAETAISHREHLLVKIGDMGTTLINFRRFIGTLDRGLTAMRSSIENHPSPDPLNLEAKITSVESVQLGDSHSKPVFIAYTSTCETLTIQRKIMFKHEDTRKDACILKIIKMLADNLGDVCTPFPLISYAVIPISNRTGLVEIVEKSQTLYSIAAATGSINNYMQHHNAQKTIGEVQRTYTLSLAFWTIITYIFGVGDRHFDNIMLSSSGILFHIDYGFIFGHDPKPYTPKIRLNAYMIEGIGGEVKYPEFKELCYRIFIAMKKNIEQIYTFLLELVIADPKIEGLEEITESFIRDHLARVFFVGNTEEGVRAGLEFIIDSAKDSWGASIGEYIHSTAKTTSRLFGRLTGISSSPL